MISRQFVHDCSGRGGSAPLLRFLGGGGWGWLKTLSPHTLRLCNGTRESSSLGEFESLCELEPQAKVN